MNRSIKLAAFLGLALLSFGKCFAENHFYYVPYTPPKPRPSYEIYNTYTPPEYRSVREIRNRDDTIELDDFSLWTITPNQSRTIRSWQEEDTVVLTPSSSGRWGDFILINNTRSGKLYVNAQKAPDPASGETLIISAVDFYKGYISLELESGGKLIFASKSPKWQAGETVSVGLLATQPACCERIKHFLYNWQRKEGLIAHLTREKEL